jgi:hypothetical protein
LRDLIRRCILLSMRSEQKKTNYSGADILGKTASRGWVRQKLTQQQSTGLWNIILSKKEQDKYKDKFLDFCISTNMTFVIAQEMEEERAKVGNKKISTTTNSDVKALLKASKELRRCIQQSSKFTKALIQSENKNIQASRYQPLDNLSYGLSELIDILEGIEVDVPKGPENPNLEHTIKRLLNIYECVTEKDAKRSFDAYEDGDSGRFLKFVQKFFSYLPLKYTNLHEPVYSGIVRNIIKKRLKERAIQAMDE